jgi:hypothetical protein
VHFGSGAFDYSASVVILTFKVFVAYFKPKVSAVSTILKSLSAAISISKSFVSGLILASVSESREYL